MNFWQDLPRPLFILAPMEAVTDVVFRHVVKKAGAPDVFFTEFTNATGWVHAGDKAIGGRLVKTDDEEPIVAQLWGAVPDDMAKLAAHCKTLGYHGIDINMGCPDASAVKAGGGAGMIRTPDNAAAVIAAAKTAGLPVSVKTRLGYSTLEEWKEWLAHLLRQDIVNLTVHLRTKKEMSKVPAHFELIPDIISLRDEIAPNTLLTINGDIENRADGLALVEKYPGIDGIMIGRGVFHNPFCFTDTFAFSPTEFSETASRPMSVEHASASIGAADVSENSLPSGSTDHVSVASTATTRYTQSLVGVKAVYGNSEDATSTFTSGTLSSRGNEEIDSSRNEDYPEGATNGSSAVSEESSFETTSRETVVSEGEVGRAANKTTLVALLHFHLDLHDKWDTPEHPRKFDPLKRFFKIYVHSFEGAAELRDKLMHTKNTAEVRAVLSDWFSQD